MNNLILASASLRRKEILTQAGYNFKIIPSDYEEKVNGKFYSENLIKNCAENKALDVFNKNRDAIIISADTVVVLDNIILGKPKDKNDAFLMLKNLSNKTHFVATGICLTAKNKKISAVEKTIVTFRKLSDKEIINYIETANPLDKAGSYGIQDKNFNFHEEIKGELDNVIGFPLKLFRNLIKDF